MSKYRNLIVSSAMAASIMASPAMAEKYGLGRPALPDEIEAWDRDIRPDGTGLPDGSGTVEDGDVLFADYCAICHGDFAEGVDNWPKLAGGADTLDHEDPLKTVGSYWPYLATTFDYVRRSMPFGNAQTLTDDEVYAVVAYILYSNDMVEEDFVLTRDNFMDVEMPNRDGFIIDDRGETEYPVFSQDPCMTDCKGAVEITMRAAVLDVTPEESRARKVQELMQATNPRAKPAVATQNDAAVGAEPAAALDPALVAAGEKAFRKCKACHQVGEGAKNKTGPILTGIVGAPAGAADGFRYSKPMQAAAESGLVWSEEELAAFLAKPKAYMKGTKMSFSGFGKDSDIAAVIAYLKSTAP